MKLKWLIEPEVFKEDSEPVLSAMEKLGINHTICKFGKSYEEYINGFSNPDHVVFYP